MTRLLAAAVVIAAFGVAGGVRAQEPAAADTSAPAPATPPTAARLAVGSDNDRFEIGAAVADGPFDLLGTLGYERYMRRGGPFEQWAHVELSGTGAGHLTEGAMSVEYLFRPVRFIRRDWPIRPILEVGPGAHLVVQVADVQGFGETAFHSRAYLKTHAIAGLETLLGKRWGLVARGRFSVPAHHPFDYAQIALFLR